MEQAPENVTFAGFVDRETLREAYCGADVFAFMSHEETEGIVVLEALACGIPTVVRDIPVYNGWLREGQNVYKASGTDEFQQKAEGLLTGTLPDLTAAGRRVAEERSLSVMGGAPAGGLPADGHSAGSAAGGKNEPPSGGETRTAQLHTLIPGIPTG